ncbi:hypothetical protein SAMN04488071_3477 [Kordiimonas lacus]|jgi:predicted 3-demethylubiquinone-9 3-methyltransferase (glyoxalase superfamily)|uniref:Uncharacterized protein n=2 Tax=Kordiimonadaceae TaxID=1331809 RepID=A0A1G7EK66_9PROT|nr:hypothetical protein SAMN04488071_3477 [Kordiimonas lacus]
MKGNRQTMRLLLPIMILFVGLGARAEENFIDGFPDVPFLSVIRALEGEPVVFDTPGGTVAEATFLLNDTAAKAMDSYRESLMALGWACDSPTTAMHCWREENRLTFKGTDGEDDTPRLVLRLEPQS